MNKRITQEELNSYLWNAAVLLRTHIDAGAYKQYVFPLLFFKRLSDVYDEECEHILEEFNDQEALYWEENHKFQIPVGYQWNDVREVTTDVGRAIVGAFHAIEQENPERLMGIFGDAAWTNKKRLPDSLLKDLMEHFSSKTLSLANCPEDELGQGYEYLIRKFADDSGHTAQEFYTNRTVVHLMTEMLKPQPSESIYDPTCGTAGMLISAIAYLKQNDEEWRNVKLYGQEINQLSSAISRMNLFLHGVEDFEVANDDTLARPAFLKEGKLRTFDMVLANPPYSISQWNREAFATDIYGRNFLGTPPQSRADYAFIQHILKSMDPETGRCAILLPHGILFRKEERAMREKLVKSDLIEAVIGLAKGLFFNSPMEACILICRSNKDSKRKNQIVFIDGLNEVEKIGSLSYLADAQIKKISHAYFSNEGIEGFSSIASLDEIEKNDYSLAIPRYVHKSIFNAVATSCNPVKSAQSWLCSSDNRKNSFASLKINLDYLRGDSNE